jgi:hypothetical protein
MNWKSQLGLAAILLLGIPSATLAQRVARMPSAPPAVRGRTALPSQTIVRGGTSRNNPGRTSSSNTRHDADDSSLNNGLPLSVQDLLNPFPGFGFNFEHLSAINQDLGIKAFIDPATQIRLAVAERIVRNNRFAPGFFLLDGGGSYVVPLNNEQQPQAQQPIIIVQQPAPQQVVEQTPAPQPAEAAASLPDEGEFTLVLRSGRQLQASAFTRQNDKIVYVTPDGGRRSVALNDLDSDATQRVNQERGVPIQLPTVSNPKPSLPEASS